ncbi:esterase/lipase family protein [Variovorax sp. PvP013]|uniref:esterase/lipase family protein n=1 Tax=Variovorax sp. PvP013 TaxID=3156435 RepID=UPI003D251C75
MRILFVHGMGRSPLSGWPLLAALRRVGFGTATFGYMTSLEDADGIVERLASRLVALGARGEHAVIGHSLGGVLLRGAIARLPEGAARPRHLFLLGSPVGAARLAVRLRSRPTYRLLTRDCGQMLASPARMAAIGWPAMPVTSVVGTRGWSGPRSPFGLEVNDGVVALSEVAADRVTDQVRLPVVHTLLPASARVADIVLARLGAPGATRTRL